MPPPSLLLSTIIIRRGLLAPSSLSLSSSSSSSSSIRRHHHSIYSSDGYRKSLSSSSYLDPSIIKARCRNMSTARSAAATRRGGNNNNDNNNNSNNNEQSEIFNTNARRKNATTTDNNKQQQQQRATDWRVWFSSTEYDDPWSPYRPLVERSTTSATKTLQQEHSPNNNSNNNSNNSTTVDNILTNYNHWERRRYGMNLVPLSLRLLHCNTNNNNNNNSPSSSSSSNNSHSSSSSSYTPIMDNDPTTTTTTTTTNEKQSIQQLPLTILKLQKRTQWIDTQTRFTIQLLNDLYYTGIRKQMDRPTTERCHRMIGRLLSLTPAEGNVVVVVGGGSGVTTTTTTTTVVGTNDTTNKTENSNSNNNEKERRVEIIGAAQRGNAILERMEWCSSPAFLPQLRKWRRQQQQQQQQQGGDDELLVMTNDNDNDDDDDIRVSSTTTSTTTTTTTNYHHLTKKIPKHLIQTKQVIPTPTVAIYNMVLLLYGKEPGPKYVAEQAEDVIWSMIVRALQLDEFNQSHSITTTSSSTSSTGQTSNENEKGRKKEGRKGDNDVGGGGGEDTDNNSSIPIYPSTQNWNCVLQCWSNSTDPNRALLAYSFFKSWMEWNVKSVMSSSSSSSSSNFLNPPDRISRANLESFHLILKSCVVDELFIKTLDDDDDGGDNNGSGSSSSSSTPASKKLITQQRAKEVGSRVAIGLWRDMRMWKDHSSTESTTLTSDTYYQLLRALCQTTNPSRGLLATVAAVYQSCRSDGLETEQITTLVRGAMTESQFQKLFV